MDEAVREVEVCSPQGLHARPMMELSDLASKFRSTVWLTNTSKGGKRRSAKSTIELLLLEAIKGSRLRIEASGEDAQAAVEALGRLIEAGFLYDDGPKGAE